MQWLIHINRLSARQKLMSSRKLHPIPSHQYKQFPAYKLRRAKKLAEEQGGKVVHTYNVFPGFE
jgi:hypothetical protein